MAAGLGSLMSVHPQVSGTNMYRRPAVELYPAAAFTSEVTANGPAVLRAGCSSVRLVLACSSSVGTTKRGMAPSRGVQAKRSYRQQRLPPWHGGEKLIQLTACKSVNVGDSAAADAKEEATNTNDSQSSATTTVADEIAKESPDLQKPFDPRAGLEENFVVVNQGTFECRSCGYSYVSASGDPSYPISPGTRFGELPEDWRCPTCGAAKLFFQSKGLEVAGFVQNQGYGLGGNSLTEGQKSLLIYGSLLFFFFLFLCGYFLQ